MAAQPTAQGAGEPADGPEQDRGLECEQQAQLGRLPAHAALIGINELRQEGQEEQDYLGIDRIGHQPAPEQGRQRLIAALPISKPQAA